MASDAAFRLHLYIDEHHGYRWYHNRLTPYLMYGHSPDNSALRPFQIHLTTDSQISIPGRSRNFTHIQMDADKAKQARRQVLLQALTATRVTTTMNGSAARGMGAASVMAAAVRRTAAAGRYGFLRGLLSARWLLEDHTRSAIILAVFGFKVRLQSVGMDICQPTDR